jgi:putative peptidoglycan lipid II flippase
VWDTITTTGWSSIGRSVGFLIPLFIAAWFGVTSETDAFFFAYGIIIFLSGVFAPVVESVIVPYIAEAKANDQDVGILVRRVLGLSGVAVLGLAGVVVLAIKPILSVVTEFGPQRLRLIHHLLVQTVPLTVLLVWTSVLGGALNAYKRFALPAVSPVFRAIVNVAIIFALKDRFGVHAIAWGYIVGELVRLAILAAIIRKLALFRVGASLGFDSELREFAKTASYQILGMVVISLNPLVDKIMASWLEAGSLSVLHYADRLYIIPVTFMTTGLMVALLSHWSDRYYESGSERLRRDVIKAFKAAAMASTVIASLLIAFHRPFVNLAYGRGVFAEERLREVGSVLLVYLFGFVPRATGLVFVRAHLVLKNTKTLLRLSVASCILHVILNYVLMKKYGVQGIALSTSITSLVIGVALMITFMKRIRNA